MNIPLSAELVRKMTAKPTPIQVFKPSDLPKIDRRPFDEKSKRRISEMMKKSWAKGEQDHHFGKRQYALKPRFQTKSGVKYSRAMDPLFHHIPVCYSGFNTTT
jgi:hypothetical protein